MTESVAPLFAGRLAVQQRVLPAYRVEFFNLLGQHCQGGLSVFAGRPLPQEGILSAAGLEGASLVWGRNLHVRDPRSPLFQCWQIGLIDWLERWQPDALIVEANPRYRSTPAAVRWMHARGRPVLGWGLGAPPLQGFLAGVRRRSRQRFLQSLDGLIAYSQRGAEEYRALGIPAERIFIAPNAVTQRPEIAPPQRPPTYRDRPTLLFVGRLQERKRVDLLLKVCAALPPELQPRLWIVGDGPARPALMELAAQIYPQAEFPGARLGEALEPYFRQADLFVLPGSGGLAVQQAMAYGLPVVVAEADGTQSDLVRPENGWLVTPGDEQALQRALLQALADPERLRTMGMAAYRIVTQEVNLEAMVAAFVQALQAVSTMRRAVARP